MYGHLLSTLNARFLQVPYPCVNGSLIFHRDMHWRELHPKELNQLLLWKLMIKIDPPALKDLYCA